MRSIPVVLKTPCGKVFKLRRDLAFLCNKLTSIDLIENPTKWCIDYIVNEELLGYDSYIKKGKIKIPKIDIYGEEKTITFPNEQYGMAIVDLKNKSVAFMENDYTSRPFKVNLTSANFHFTIREELHGEQQRGYEGTLRSELKKLWEKKFLTFSNNEDSYYNIKCKKSYEKYDWSNDWETFMLLAEENHCLVEFDINNGYNFESIERISNEDCMEREDDRSMTMLFAKACARMINKLREMDFEITEEEIKAWQKELNRRVKEAGNWEGLSIKEFDDKYHNGKSIDYNIKRLLKRKKL